MNTLVDLLDHSAKDFSKRTALTMRVGVRTIKYDYAKLDERAHAFARFMGERAVKKGDRVVIWAPNQPDWVAAMFGSFIAGAVVVPLDVRSSRDFVERVITQTEPVLAFGGKAQCETLREMEIPSYAFETLNLPVNGKVSPTPLAPTDLAEIIFTSGTTGDPKGVMLSHANIVANVRAGIAAIPIERDTRMLSLLPLSHMFEQIGGCFAALHVGAAVCYPASRQPAALSRTMQEWKPTFIMGVPQVLTLLMNGVEREAAAQGKTAMLNRLRKLATPFPEGVRRRMFRTVLKRFGGKLEFIASGGAAIDPEIQVKWEQMGVAVVEGYGTTECSPVISINPRHDRRIRSVGKPLPGQQVKIAEDGEVLTRGPNVFSGYWKNEAATAGVFEDDWYKTGDLGYLEDGFLYLKGRKKDLIVLSDGQNVYPDDIEEVLRHEEGVADAVVLGLKDGTDIRLHAVIVESEAGAGPGAVKTANSKLDDRQQLFAWTIWPDEDFPRTHTLKVKRPVVHQFVTDQAPVSSVASHLVSDDPLIKLVAGVRKGEGEITEASTLGLDLQLDSLGRVELLSAIEDEMGVYVDDTEVGPHTTVAELRAMVLKGDPKAKVRRFPTWPRRRPVRWARRMLMSGLVFPLLRLGYTVQIRGRNNFKGLQEPVLIVSNHNMHLDGSMLLRSMPHGFRQRVAIAAAASDIFGNKLRGFGAGLLGNAFPFAKEGSGVRESLESVARMLDEGWNVLIFPEGKLTVAGPTQPFKSGTGLLAVETGVPVLPMRIDILRPGFYEGKWLPHPHGRVRVNIGAPVTFPPGTSYSDATKILEEAVRTA